MFFYVQGTDAQGQRVSENRILEILADGSPTDAVRVPLAAPFMEFYTATTRAGSPPSKTLELLGIRRGSSSAVSYARIRIDY